MFLPLILSLIISMGSSNVWSCPNLTTVIFMISNIQSNAADYAMGRNCIVIIFKWTNCSAFSAGCPINNLRCVRIVLRSSASAASIITYNNITFVLTVITSSLNWQTALDSSRKSGKYTSPHQSTSS